MKVRLHLLIWFLLSGLCFNGQILWANNERTQQELIEAGNDSYSKGQFSDALDLYLQVYNQGFESASLLMNIGNAYYKINDIPSSILFYERALRLAPSDEDVIFNLGLARSRIIDKIEEVPKLFFLRWWDQIRRGLSLQVWTYISILGFTSFLLLFAIYLISRTSWSKQLFFWPALVSLILTIHAFIFAAQLKNERIQRSEAIIFTPTVTIKSSPDYSSVDLFVLHEGTKVQITDSIGNWIEIRIASGSKGWLENTVVKRI